VRSGLPWTTSLVTRCFEGLARPRPLALAAAVLLVAATLSLHVAGFHDLRHDDAFISFRYGDNLATGRGLVFNSGERLMGSTAPAHVLLAAGLRRVVGHERLPTAMSILGCVAWTAQAVAVVVLLRGALGLLGAMVIGLLVASGAAGSAQWVALETNLVVATALWALVLAQASRWIATACVCAVAVLLRPDAILLALLLGAECWRRQRTAAWRPAAVFLALCLPWLLFATAYFGSPIPQSLAHKLHWVRLGSYLRHVWSHPVMTLLPVKPWETLPIAAIWLLAAAGTVALVRRDRRLWPLPAWAGIHLVAYLWLRPLTSFAWHLYAPTLVFTVLAASALAYPGTRARRGVVRLALLAGLVVVAGAHARATLGFARGHGHAFWNGARNAVYREVAGFLRRHGTPGDVVWSVEVGTIAYYSDLPVFDRGGLVTRRPFTEPRYPAVRWMVVAEPFRRFEPRPDPTAVFRRDGFATSVFDLRPTAR
jgi:arabinofuranosyltransferase